jgi:hypothetical protein
MSSTSTSPNRKPGIYQRFRREIVTFGDYFFAFAMVVMVLYLAFGVK